MASTMTKTLAQIFDIAISKGVRGMTIRWSIVPCSRSRTRAAPARMIARSVTLEMIPITLVNQAVATFGLNAILIARLTGVNGTDSAWDRNWAISVLMICSA